MAVPEVTPALGLDAWANHLRMLREDEEYRRAYEALEGEFAAAEELIKARVRAGLTLTPSRAAVSGEYHLCTYYE